MHAFVCGLYIMHGFEQNIVLVVHVLYLHTTNVYVVYHAKK